MMGIRCPKKGIAGGPVRGSMLGEGEEQVRGGPAEPVRALVIHTVWHASRLLSTIALGCLLFLEYGSE